MNAMLPTRKREAARSHRMKGFSLIELLIVVAIILIIAAIAIPNLMKSKMVANEASAVESLRTIDTGETTYATESGHPLRKLQEYPRQYSWSRAPLQQGRVCLYVCPHSCRRLEHHVYGHRIAEHRKHNGTARILYRSNGRGALFD